MSTTASEPHVGDVGFAIKLRVYENGSPVDLSGAATKSIKLRKPNGTVVTKTAVFPSGGTDGWLQYVTVADDLDIPGRWSAQAYITGLAGWSGHAEVFDFVVKRTA